MKSIRLTIPALALTFAVAAVAQTTNQNPVQAPATRTYLRVVNASPNSNSVDVYLDNQRISSGVNFKAATDFLMVSAQLHSLKFTLSGNPQSVLYNTKITPKSGRFHTFALIEKPGGLKSLVFVAQNLSPSLMANVEVTEKPETAVEAAKEEQVEIKARALKVKLTMYHLAPNAPSVNVVAPGLKPLIAQIGFGQVQVARRKAIKMTLKILAVGATTAPVLSSADFKPGGSYSVFVFPNAKGNGFEVLTLETRVQVAPR